MHRSTWLALATLLVLPAAPAQAQDCTVIENETFNVTNSGTPQQVTHVTGVVFRCPGGKLLRAATAYSFEASGMIDMSGNVYYADAERSVSADNAQYFKREQRIIATGNAVVRDLRSGSVIRGNRLEYTQAAPGREAYLQASPSVPRPTALLVDDRTPGRRDTTTVEADMLELFGENRFRATGTAILRRDSLSGFGAQLDYDQRTGSMELVVNARLEGPSYQLTGDTVRALMEQDTIRQVSSHGAAVLTTKDITVESPFLRLVLEQGELERLIADRKGSRGGVGGQAHIRAERFRLVADSIDALAPGQQLERVIAIGTAYGEVLDTLPPPTAEGELQAALAHDWMKGDTVQAFFAVNPRAATDSTVDERVLERVVTSGAPASSLYRKLERVTAPADAAADAELPGPRYSIGYLLARRIEVFMQDGEVADVKATDDVRGLYLQPRSGTQLQARR